MSVAIAPADALTIMAQKRLRYYASKTFPGFKHGKHIALIADALERVSNGQCKRLIITMPPRHSKSFFTSERFPAWHLSRHPDDRVINACHTASLAEDFSYTVRELIESDDSPFRIANGYTEDIRIADNKGRVQEWKIADHQGGYVAVGVGGSIAGKGGNIILVDDPIKNAAAAASQRERDNVWRWFTRDLYSRRQPGAAIVVTNTRWNDDDLTGRLLKRMAEGGEQWEHIHLPAIATGADDLLGREAGEVLWPEFWTEDDYALAQNNMPPDAWLSLYQGMPTSDEGALVKRTWLHFWQYRGQNLPPVPVYGPRGDVIAAHPVRELPPWFDTELASWDASFKETESGSYVAGLHAAVAGSTTFLLDRYRERASFPDTIRAIMNMRTAHPHTREVLVEAKANGPAIIDTLRPNVPGMIAVEPDGDKVARLHAVTYYIESGNLVLPHPTIAPWVDEYIEELVTFPKAANDDQVDATSQLLRRIIGGIDSGMDAVVDDFMRDFTPLGGLRVGNARFGR